MYWDVEVLYDFDQPARWQERNVSEWNLSIRCASLPRNQTKCVWTAIIASKIITPLLVRSSSSEHCLPTGTLLIVNAFISRTGCLCWCLHSDLHQYWTSFSYMSPLLLTETSIDATFINVEYTRLNSYLAWWFSHYVAKRVHVWSMFPTNIETIQMWKGCFELPWWARLYDYGGW